MKKILFLTIFFLLATHGAILVLAAEISVTTNSPSVGRGQEFLVDVMVDPQSEDINAIEGGILFPSKLMEFKEARVGDSFITLWVEPPRLLLPSPEGVNLGEIVFSGITPGGFQGLLSPYYKGARPGKLFSLVFKSREPGSELVQSNQIKVLLNDGRGTLAPISFKNTLITVRNVGASSTLPAIVDAREPEVFKPEVLKIDGVFGGRWVLIFSAQDKESGIDHYEFFEKRGSPATSYDNLKWAAAVSPQPLSDQTLMSFIYVKAVDRAGNARVEIIAPRYPQGPERNRWYWGTLILIVAATIVYGIRRALSKKK